MRIDTVKATAFGPFAGETLDLAPGMNVIYGPNESGKSSWHAAIYAALCGMRKTRGQPTREDRTFASRHRPWRGTGWRVSAVVTLDTGQTIDIDQSLGPGGRSTATDRVTTKPLGNDVVQAGAVDAATLLGLSREAALATLFVRQADILRVVTDAMSLQEYLERAAATSAATTTAEEALARIATYRKERVGLLRAGSRGPLAVATARLAEARKHLDKAEERFEGYQDLLARRHAAEITVNNAEYQLRELSEHEQKRKHRELWTEIRAARRRIEQARNLTQQLGDTRIEVADSQLVTAVTRSLAAFATRPDIPPDLEGPSAAELEAELATIPQMPVGDLEPADEVVALVDTYHARRQRLEAHAEIEPTMSTSDAPTVPPAELRRLAEELEWPVPEVDAELVHDIEHRRASVLPQLALSRPTSTVVPKRRRSLVPIVVAAALTIAGVAVLSLDQLAVGIALIVVGVATAVVGALSRRRDLAQPAVHHPSQVAVAEPPLDPELPRLEARLALQQEAMAQAQRRRASAIARVAELGLADDPDALRRHAAEGDAATAIRGRRVAWEERRTELQTSERVAKNALLAALAARSIVVNDGADVDQCFHVYVQQCRERLATARRAERRNDLEAQLASRRAAEAAYEQDRAARQSAEAALRVVADHAGCEAGSLDELATTLRDWAAAQKVAGELRQQQEQTAARLDQLLDGHSIEGLEAEIEKMTEGAGDAPPEDAAPLEDLSAELQEIQSLTHTEREKLAEVAGQLDGAEKHLLDVSAAIEDEARAASEVVHLAALAEDLDLASEILTSAQAKVHADIAPVLNDAIRPWVPKVTKGRYDDVRVDPATLEIKIHEAGGQFRTATDLSHGTTEQIFLLLRLALAQHLTTTGEKAPIVLDDITVQSDAQRTTAILNLLHHLSKEHQIVLFSQEDEVLRWATDHIGPPRDQLLRLDPR
jgi:recombinational DNA repair ATPase RecF